jgi:hypothetical protein
MASKASQNGVQGAESAPFDACFEAFPLCWRARPGGIDRLWLGASCCAETLWWCYPRLGVLRPKSHPRVRHEKKRRPVRRTNPAPWLFPMARVASQSGDQGADSALFCRWFRSLSSACWRARPVSIDRLWPGASNRGDLVPSDSGLTQDPPARVPPLKDAPACATNESSTVAFQNGEGDLPK